MTADPLSTWQTDGIVWSLAYAKGVVYVGGTFDHIRPPGAAPGSQELARKNFAAFDAKTGKPLACAPKFTGGSNTIRAMKASPDGSLIYIGGSFSKAGPVGRSNTAALKTADCTIGANWKPKVNSIIRAIDVTADTVYIGGLFGTVQAQTRERIAALRPDSTLLPFQATVRGASHYDSATEVYAITVAPKLNKVIIGGNFTRVNNTGVNALAGLNATTGKTVNAFTDYITPAVTAPYLPKSRVKSLANDGTNFFVGAEGAFDGRIAGRLSDGFRYWTDNCIGATQVVLPYKDVLYSGSHAWDCQSTPGGWHGGWLGPGPTARRQHFLAQSISTLPDGSRSLAPTTTILPWFPDTNDGIGEKLGPRTMTMGGGVLWAGGEFTTVNGKRQQGLTRFSASPDIGTPQVPLLSASSPSSGKIKLNWKASWDRDDGTLTYKIYRDGVYLTSLNQDSRYWNRPAMSFTDTVTPGSRHRYSLEVTDGTNVSGRNGPIYVTALPSATNQQVAIPAYWSPKTADGAAKFSQLAKSSSANGIVVISGGVPGPEVPFNATYAQTIKKVHDSGKRVIGYVDSGFLGTPPYNGAPPSLTRKTRTDGPGKGSSSPEAWFKQIVHDIDGWYRLYGESGVDGIFLDQATQYCAYAPSYAALRDHIKKRHPGAYTIINPGLPVDQCYENAADTIITFEGSYDTYQRTSPKAWQLNSAHPEKFWHLIHNAPNETAMAAAVSRSKQQNAGYVYVTNGTTTVDPSSGDTIQSAWGTIPPYWNSELAAASGRPQP
ncbi:spherulation-specific family 4 protein [Streptomyces sp. NPDC006283]|uniref:spherulation-specific family 4 protein n=1 Tax=Streptomyces sp. NPDC006283 TaxID=3156741 RepID=UPI0033BEB975